MADARCVASRVRLSVRPSVALATGHMHGAQDGETGPSIVCIMIEQSRVSLGPYNIGYMVGS